MTNFRTSVINLERPGNPDVFSAAIRADAANLMARYPKGQARSALLPLLHLVQSEQGYITPDGIAFCADVLDITKAQVAAVATFYTMYKRVPTGEYLVSICTNTLCGMMGATRSSTRSPTISVSPTTRPRPTARSPSSGPECLAACDYAPVVTVNYEFYDNQSVESTRELVGELQAGNRPLPSRGAPLCSFKQAERQIAGFFTTDDYALEAAATGARPRPESSWPSSVGNTAPSYAVDTQEPKAALMTDDAAAKATVPEPVAPPKTRKKSPKAEPAKASEPAKKAPAKRSRTRGRRQQTPAGQGTLGEEQAAASQQGPEPVRRTARNSRVRPEQHDQAGAEKED